MIDAPSQWVISGATTSIRVKRTLAKDFDLAIWFVRSLNKLRGRLKKVIGATPPTASLWVSWTRKAGGHESDVTEQAIRDLVLPLGLVDVKVAALDQNWSGLKLVWRLSRRATVAERYWRERSRRYRRQLGAGWVNWLAFATSLRS